MVLVIGPIARDSIPKDELQEWFDAYISILERFRLWLRR